MKTSLNHFLTKRVIKIQVLAQHGTGLFPSWGDRYIRWYREDPSLVSHKAQYWALFCSFCITPAPLVRSPLLCRWPSTHHVVFFPPSESHVSAGISESPANISSCIAAWLAKKRIPARLSCCSSSETHPHVRILGSLWTSLRSYHLSLHTTLGKPWRATCPSCLPSLDSCQFLLSDISKIFLHLCLMLCSIVRACWAIWATRDKRNNRLLY